MQYILTETEYKELITRAEAAKADARKTINGLCRQVATLKPIKRSWSPQSEPSPWGCIKNRVGSPHYCDDCPVVDVCQESGKQFSQ